MTDSPEGGRPQPQDPTQPVQPSQPGAYGGDPSHAAPPGYGYPPYYGQPPVAYAPDHPKATTALVLGILSIVLCQVLGPFAWSTGKRAVNEIDASHGQLGGRGTAQAGYVMGVIATVLLGIGILMLVVLLGLGALGAGLASTSG